MVRVLISPCKRNWHSGGKIAMLVLEQMDGGTFAIAHTVRGARRLQAWACKRAKKAASQLIGALRTGASRPMWCEHRRRGRVDFYTGLPAVAHGIVLIEVIDPVTLRQESDELPLVFNGIPISY